MSHDLVPGELRQLSGSQLQHRLLADLDGLLREIEDGTVKENTFEGCIAPGKSNLHPLSEAQSRQIKDALSYKPVVTGKSEAGGLHILDSVLNLIRSLWGSHATDPQPASQGAAVDSLFLDRFGRVRTGEATPGDGTPDRQGEEHEISPGDVTQFFRTRGKEYKWVLPYAWDIANQLNAVQKSETEGDLALFFERRRKLNVQRPKATRFEQSVQRYAEKVSELYSDENGNITDEKSLEAFIGELVNSLLEGSRTYWPTSPLLAIFDAVIATVIRPLLHKHRTAHFQSKLTTAGGVIVSGNTMAKLDELVTTPGWNETSQRLVTGYVKKAFKTQVWSLFLDMFAPYNREYARSEHLNAAALTDVGLLIKDFGDPLHLDKIMELLKPTSQADELARFVVNHLRGDEFIDH